MPKLEAETDDVKDLSSRLLPPGMNHNRLWEDDAMPDFADKPTCLFADFKAASGAAEEIGLRRPAIASGEVRLSKGADR
ncbi:hypothetical protein [Neorhizobium sp. DAR64860/K0K1]|uniref:hypothetical protein n=1 Tax=Neorhizobium sp. DAR64860/K0K1 TaxID=3421955 RepID=UPI003D282918